jgi:hypothetical protein
MNGGPEPGWIGVLLATRSFGSNQSRRQHLYDSDKRQWRFVLCGSSARKLRVTGANLLAGRSLLHRLYPLLLVERPPAGPAKIRVETPLPMPAGDAVTPALLRAPRGRS